MHMSEDEEVTECKDTDLMESPVPFMAADVG
jgi:hypothetical protein